MSPARSRTISPPQRDAEQKPHPRHDPVAIADAQPALDQVQLEAADVVSCRRVRRAPQERGEAPAAVDVASLRMAPQLAGSHILDHTPTQRADGGISAHGELLLSEVANTSSSSGRGSPPRYNRALNSLPTPPMAPPRSGYRGSDLVPWHIADDGLAASTFRKGPESRHHGTDLWCCGSRDCFAALLPRNDRHLRRHCDPRAGPAGKQFGSLQGPEDAEPFRHHR